MEDTDQKPHYEEFRFELKINFTLIQLVNYCQIEDETFDIELEFIGENIPLKICGEKKINSTQLEQQIDYEAVLSSNENEIDEYLDLLGNPLMVKLVSTKKKSSADSKIPSAKVTKAKKTNMKADILPKNNIFAVGNISLLSVSDDLKEHTIKLYPFDQSNLEIFLKFTVFVKNPPKIPTQSVSITIEQIFNLVENENEVHMAIHIPENEDQLKSLNFKNLRINEKNEKIWHNLINQLVGGSSEILAKKGFKALLYPEYFKTHEITVEQNSAATYNLLYRNWMSLEYFKILLEKNLKILLEVQISKKSQTKHFMGFIDLNVFNFPGANRTCFLVSLQDFNKDLIKEYCGHQQLSFEVSKVQPKALKSQKSLNVSGIPLVSNSNGELIKFEDLAPALNDEGLPVCVTVEIEFSEPLFAARSDENLLVILNENLQFFDEPNLSQIILEQAERDFELEILGIIEKLKVEIGLKGLLIYEKDIRETVNTEESFYDQKKFKETLKTLIGCRYNVECQTETNEQFKHLMISIFEDLSKKSSQIIHNGSPSISTLPVFDLNLREKYFMAAEEEFEAGNMEKALEILDENVQNFTICEESLVDQLIMSFRCKLNVKAILQIIVKILKLNHISIIGHYALASIFLEECNLDLLEVSLNLLTSLNPLNVTFWIVLKNLYNRKSDKCGEDFCHLKICELLTTPDLTVSHCKGGDFSWIEIPTDKKILKNIFTCLKLGFFGILESLLDFALNQKLLDPFEVQYVELIVCFLNKKFHLGLELANSMEMNDQNEMAVRFLKGNFLHKLKQEWLAVCEYEILCHKQNKNKMLYLPALRCGQFYYKEKKLEKAKRYFMGCCKSFASFTSLMGLGRCFYDEYDFIEAEKIFHQALKLDKNSGEVWLFLALCSHHSRDFKRFKIRFNTARQYEIQNQPLLEVAEKILDY